MDNAFSFVEFGNIAEFRNGMNFSKDSRGKGCWLIGVSDFQKNFTPDYDTLEEINPEGITKKDDYLKKGDIIFVRSNGNKALVGRSLYIDRDINALFSGFCIRARLVSDLVDPLFLAYFTRTEHFKSSISSVAGTNINNLNQDILSSVRLPLYPKKVQLSITNVLSTIDAKIELNLRINSELESMAKMLYDYWFVQFEFPNENGKPYKSSGGKMVWNEELKRKIPLGWKCFELSKLVKRIATGLNPRKNFVFGNGNNFYVTIKNIDYGKVILDDRCDKIDSEALKIIDRRSDLQIGDVLFTSIEPVGKTYILQEKPTNWNINESVFTIRANYEMITPEYLYFLLSSETIKSFTNQSSAGSTFKGIRIGVLNTFLSPYSNKNLITGFSEIVKPLLKKIDIVQKESQTLIKLRDWLLPMLMNGQVKAS
jgi:type I restriction enzyme S subunit